MVSMAHPVLVLPRYIAIKADNGKFLALKADGLLDFDASEMTRLTTHEVLYNVDDAQSITFIIRSANNRFWIRDSNDWIRAVRERAPLATQKDARFNLAKFESGRLGFQSAVDGLYMKRYEDEDDFVKGYKVMVSTPDEYCEVEVTDASAYAIYLPRNVYFKGNDGRYLQQSNSYVIFNDPKEFTHVISLVDGSLLMRTPTNGYWKGGGYITVDTAVENACRIQPERNKSMLNDSMVSLKTSNGFCVRYSGIYLLDNSSSNSEATTHLATSRATSERQIYGVKYLLNLACTTQFQSLTIAYGEATNTSVDAMDLTINGVVSPVSKSRTWSDCSNYKFKDDGVKTVLTAGVPFLANSKFEIEVGAEETFENVWNETTREAIEIKTQYLVKNVQPRTTASVTVLCNTVKLRIPFTYKSKDDGAQNPEEGIDGIFEAVEVYKVYTVVLPENLKQDDSSDTNTDTDIGDGVHVGVSSDTNKETVGDTDKACSCLCPCSCCVNTETVHARAHAK